MRVESISLIVSPESQSDSMSYGLQIGLSVSRHENDINLSLQVRQSSWTPGTSLNKQSYLLKDIYLFIESFINVYSEFWSYSSPGFPILPRLPNSSHPCLCPTFILVNNPLSSPMLSICA